MDKYTQELLETIAEGLGEIAKALGIEIRNPVVERLDAERRARAHIEEQNSLGYSPYAYESSLEGWLGAEGADADAQEGQGEAVLSEDLAGEFAPPTPIRRKGK